jgi:cyclopropane fatty-acyl-phospholipid synthase-like methyltransferase
MSEFVRPDFDALYRAGAAPWDTGAPQPEVVRLADEGSFHGAVIDVGCGTGENALLLAERGLDVTGVDASTTAIATARARAAERGLEVRFEVADALDLRALRRRFESALDCGLFHVLDDAERPRYAESLAEAIASGAQAHLLCFSDDEPPGPGPRRVSEWDIRSTFRGLFVVSRLRRGLFESRIHAGGARAWVATLTRI